jgi:hypothetical protein
LHAKRVVGFLASEGGALDSWPFALQAFFLQNLFDNIFPSRVPRVCAPARAFAYTCSPNNFYKC